MPLYLRVHHVALTAIGALSTVGLAWTLKVFWSPLVDAFGTYRRWIASAVLAMTLILATFALRPETVGREFWVLITILVFASATQDIAIDAFTIRITPQEMLGPVNSIRVIGYRVAIIGVWRALLLLGIAQTTSNLGYAIVATIHAGRWAIYAAAVVENFGFGLGTAAFLAFLMAICDRERAATEYAMLTATFGLTRALIGPVSGWLAQHAGYPTFFWSTVFFGIPAL